MDTTWRETTIGEIVQLFDHRRVPLSNQERKTRQGPYPYYGASGIIDHIDGFLFSGRYLLVAEDGENLNSRKLPVAFFASGDFWVNNHAHIIRAIPDLADDYFIKAWFHQANISGYITGAAQPKLTQENLRRISLPLPPLPTQRRIAAILSAYDDLIEVNTRRIALLEEMAAGLYREWFVRFRFPGHERARMVESAVGVVPEGWEVVKTTDAIDVNPSTKVPADGEKPFVMMNGISTNTMLITGIEYRTGNSGAKYKNGDTLFARITPCLENGKTAFVQFLPTDDAVACGSTEFIVLRSRTLCPEFVYLLARSDTFRDNAIKSMSGASGRQRVQEACFDKFLFAHPDRKTLDAFARLVSPLFRMVQLLADKNANLRRTRDLLLPRLVAGEVGVDAG